jgi:4-amino-4-deoxy-L-arabinose transferase-like glycosyltransferase
VAGAVDGIWGGVPPRRASGFAFRLSLMVALGVAIRVLYTVLVAPWPPKGLDDQVYYHLEPILLAHGRGFIEPVFAKIGRTVPTAEHAPLYPVVLAGLAKLGGTGDVVQRLTGTVFGAGTIVAVGLLGRRLAGDRAGILAAGIAAVYPILITADGALMSESLFGLLVAVSLLAAYRLLDAPSIGRALLLGAVVGLAALTRGEAVLLLVLLVIPIVRRPQGGRIAAAACAALVIVLTPWTVRNWIVFGRFVAISTDTGAVIGGANCDQTYYGKDIGGWSYICNHVSPGNEADESARDQSVGVHYALHHLRRLPVVVAARLERVWGLRQPMQTNSGRSAWAQNVGTIMYYLLLAPAAYGFLLLRGRRVATWMLMSPVVLVTLTSVLGYGFLRFREPAEITLVVLAAIAVDQLWRRFSEGSRARLIGRAAPNTQSVA